jgi:hypothetical protein
MELNKADRDFLTYWLITYGTGYIPDDRLYEDGPLWDLYSAARVHTKGLRKYKFIYTKNKGAHRLTKKAIKELQHAE